MTNAGYVGTEHREPSPWLPFLISNVTRKQRGFCPVALQSALRLAVKRIEMNMVNTFALPKRQSEGVVSLRRNVSLAGEHLRARVHAS